MIKYHISPDTQRPNICKANKQGCKFGDNIPHFDNKQEAREYVQNKLAQTSSILTSSKKLPPKNELPNSKNLRVENLKNHIQELLNENTVTLNSLDKIGTLVDNEIMTRLSFDPNEIMQKDISQEQYDEIENVNRQVVAELVSCSQGSNRVVHGARAKDLEKTITILPDGAKRLVSDDPIEAKTISRGSILGGSYQSSVVNAVIPLVEEVSPYHDPGDSIEEGQFFNNSDVLPIDIQENNVQSFRIMKKGSNNQYLCGKKPSKGKKVEDSIEVYINGEKMVINKPVYQMFTQEQERRSILTIPKADSPITKSTIIHEYSHAIQHGYYKHTDNNETSALDSEMYESLKGESFYSESYSIESYKGFPDDYMGSSYRELFPMSTEGLFNPSSDHRGYFYGKDKHKNSDKIKNWTIGFWLHLDNIGKNK